MKSCSIFITCVFLAGAFALVGCKGDSKDYTLDNLIKKDLFGMEKITPAEQAAGAFDESDPDVRRTAIEMLSKKKWALRDPYLKRFAVLTNSKMEKDPSVRAVAVRTLGRAGNPKYHPQIMAALYDPSPVVRWDAAAVMDHMPNEEAIVRLQWMAIDKDETVDVRASAVRAMRHYRTNPVYKTLLRCMDDDDFTVRTSAHRSLVYLTGRDMGAQPENWAKSPGEIGRETLPEPVVRYKKRPWWDWMKKTKETEEISPAKAKKEQKRAWWDWFGVKKEEK